MVVPGVYATEGGTARRHRGAASTPRDEAEASPPRGSLPKDTCSETSLCSHNHPFRLWGPGRVPVKAGYFFLICFFTVLIIRPNRRSFLRLSKYDN